VGGYVEASGGGNGNIYCGNFASEAEAKADCCSTQGCFSVTYLQKTKAGCLKKNGDGGYVTNPDAEGFVKTGGGGGSGDVSMTVQFSSVGWSGAARVRDLWTRRDLGSFSTSFTALVPKNGVVFIKLSK